MANTIDPRTAWQPYKPDANNPWDLKKVGHVYRRATFGASWDELQTGFKLGPQELIDAIAQGRAARAGLRFQNRAVSFAGCAQVQRGPASRRLVALSHDADRASVA